MNLYLKEPRAIHIDQECKVKDLNAGGKVIIITAAYIIVHETSKIQSTAASWFVT